MNGPIMPIDPLSGMIARCSDVQVTMPVSHTTKNTKGIAAMAINTLAITSFVCVDRLNAQPTADLRPIDVGLIH